MDLSLLFAGPAVLVRRAGQALLFGCPEGTQRALMRTSGLVDVDAVLLPSLDPPDWLGLPGMLKSFDLRDRDAPLVLAGPPGTGHLLAMIESTFGRLGYECEPFELRPGETLEYDEHDVTCGAAEEGRLAFSLVEPARPGRFDPVRAAELGVQPGPDFGRLQRGEPVGDVQPQDVLGEARPGRVVALAPAAPEAARADVVVDGAHVRPRHGEAFTARDGDLLDVPLQHAVGGTEPVVRTPGEARPRPVPAGPPPGDAVRVTLLGTAASVPTARRALTAALVQAGGRLVLVDCGEGTTEQLRLARGEAHVDAVLLTHLHADHWLGLPGLLRAHGDAPPLVVGPPGTGAALRRLGSDLGRVDLTELDPVALRALDVAGLRAEPVPVEHRGPAFGWALTAPAGQRVVLSGDTAPCEAVRVVAAGADLLVHEATFLEDDAARARLTRHSTARQAAQVAADAGVARLALTHLSSRYAPRAVKDEAREVFARAVVPRDLEHLDLPARPAGPAAAGGGPAAPTSGRPGGPTAPAVVRRRRRVAGGVVAGLAAVAARRLARRRR